jgi:hypothetical protein
MDLFEASLSSRVVTLLGMLSDAQSTPKTSWSFASIKVLGLAVAELNRIIKMSPFAIPGER